MHRRILSASVQGTPGVQFHPGIHILWGQNAEDVGLTLAGIFGGTPPQNGKPAHILDGARLPVGISGESDLLLKKLSDVLAKGDDRPLFVINFLERLDEAVDLQAICIALLATGRQVFIAVPHSYNIKPLEEMPYVTIIRTL